MSQEEIFSSTGQLIARFVKSESLWLNPGLAFWSSESEFVQVGTWAHPEGTKLPAHIHNVFPREALRTQETVYVVQGSLQATLFDDNGELVTEIAMRAGDLLVCLTGGHGYSINEPETRVLEIKNGPDSGPERDRRRLE
jgi:oxalate decarboxylase/phosphoglucose isomerase-like protein (cupin superfamily)